MKVKYMKDWCERMAKIEQDAMADTTAISPTLAIAMAKANQAARWAMRPRTKPYTSLGIGRVPCVRCGAPSVHQWQVCADQRRFRTLCLDCDIALNRMVLEWAGDPDAEAKLEAYEKEQRT